MSKQGGQTDFSKHRFAVFLSGQAIQYYPKDFTQLRIKSRKVYQIAYYMLKFAAQGGEEGESESEVAQSYTILCNPMDLQPTRLLPPWDCPGKRAGVGCHFSLQGGEEVVIYSVICEGDPVQPASQKQLVHLFTSHHQWPPLSCPGLNPEPLVESSHSLCIY